MAKYGIKIIKVKNSEEGNTVCKSLLYRTVSRSSVLLLSGGSTPKTLYEILVKEQKLNAGAAALVDERFIQNPKLKTSNAKTDGTNERMIMDTGLIRYIENIGRFYPVLEDKGMEETARDYDETVRFLFSHFKRSVGIFGIGADGHTAGLPAGISNLQPPTSNKTELVTAIDNFPGEYRERISLTFLGISKIDEIIILAFGKDKKNALKQVFKGDDISEIPARFFKTEGIAQKTTLITDLRLP